MKAELRGNSTTIPIQNPNLFNNPQNSLTGALKGCIGSLDGACLEKLLLHCANALENNDVTLAQQVMWVLNNLASSNGDPNQRLTSWFLRALISRASRVCPTATNNYLYGSSNLDQRRLMSVTELAGYVDLIPWHRFGYCASNSAIYKAIEGHTKVHILDFSITHCMQWPTLIDAIAKRPEGPPSLRISVPCWRPSVPPFLNVSSEEVGLRLANFAKFRDVPFEFHMIEDLNYDMLLSQLSPSTLQLRDDEALVVNCQNWLRYMPDEQIKGSSISSRDIFLDRVKDLNPCIMTVVDEDSDLGNSSLKSRLATCFNYLWIPFDALETFLPKDSRQRLDYEADIGHKIENIIGFEGFQRIERLECCNKFSQRMENSGFMSVPFCEETIKEVKSLLDEHASGWGMKNEDDMLVLTWKGHNSVYATAWVLVPPQMDMRIE
ncbi:PREDICTED: scarecrow-like protein 32 [Nicotiana attenuata]|uniref:Scarecrow-like protein 32 n=1 Tax=Nicotiana attenuata TaxID=49451 RepID=A0A1J6IIK3_NICAT|nr:PREDICTED: scarecrow-like protein 32 [Nicotiana attenuata]OIT00352.1 scarecrow-like protein 32 [Nicotiana attenuata]